MVNRLRPGRRAQLMLVGAVAIALILMGLVVVFNTVLFTQTNSAKASLSDAQGGQAFSDQIRKESKKLALRIYNDTGSLDTTYYENNVSALSETQGVAYARSAPVYVSVSCVDCVGSGSITDGTPDLDGDDQPDVVLEVTYETPAFQFTDQIAVRFPASP